jgi:uncharacterized protein YjbI with pentapeptide repeats
MKAHEVLKRYADGRRDFSGENLRGQSFKGKDLSGANFSDADIRGANFTNAKLTNANFSGAKAGLQRRWAILLIAVSLLLSMLSVAVSGLSGLIVSGLLSQQFINQEKYTVAPGVTVSITLALFFIFTVPKGYTSTVGVLVLTLAATAALVGTFGTSVEGGGTAAIAFSGAVVGTGSVAVAVTLSGAIAGARAVALSGAVALLGAFTFPLSRSKAESDSDSMGAMQAAVEAAMVGTVSRFVAAVVAIAVVSLGSYVGWQALAGDKKSATIQRIGVVLATMRGTSFRGADLTDADFTQATLKSTDFRGATLTRTRWHQAKKLSFVRPGTTYLQFPQVRHLLITRQGQAQNFDRQPLRGVNLQGANLADASFIGADLNEANLQDADLSRTKLVQTQLDETDLTGATLTGAYIEDWGITSHTKLHGVRCEYVFMRLPTKEDPEPRRKPDNRNETFKDGDFADFIKPIVDTLDLYHNQDVDPRAIAISFKQLAENHPEAELEIVAMEKRGGDKFLLRAATDPDADHSELNAEYFDTYNEIKALAEREIKPLIEEKDSRISSLENMIATALQRPSFYANTYHQVGDFMSESKGNISITSGDGSKISGVAGAGENMTGSAMADVSGTVTIAINELPDSSEPEKPGIKELLSQLQAAINDPNLADDDKAQALEQIKVLAEAGQNPKNETAQKQAKKAMGFLKVIAEGLPSAAQLVKTCQDILPAIAHYFGLG